MLGNLSGWHLMIIGVIMLVIIAVVAVVVVAIFVVNRRSAAPTAAQRLQQIDDLRAHGSISPEEYAQKREQVLREL